MEWFRVHEKRFSATGFNPGPSHRYYGGGRFDGTGDDPYGFCYLASTPNAAVSEALLRDLPVDHTGPRVLERVRVRGRRVSPLVLIEDVEVVAMTTGSELGALSQDTWLTTAAPRDYAQTRHWGHWIREHTTASAGLMWRSLREPDDMVIVLFDDRVGPAPLGLSMAHPLSGDNGDFDSRVGHEWLEETMSSYGVSFG